MGFTTTDNFLRALGVGAFVVIVVAACVRILANYAINRFVQMSGHRLAERVLDTYLRQPYTFFLNRHSSDLAKTILSEVNQVVNAIYRPGMNLVAQGISVIVLVTLLIVVDPWVALTVSLVLGGTYGAIYLGIHQLIARMGKERVTANRARFQVASEAFAGIKDIKVHGLEFPYLIRFRRPSIDHAKRLAAHATISQIPKFGIEAIGFGGIIALSLALIGREGGSLGNVLPVLGLYAFAGYRLLPAVQKIYQSITQMRFGAAALDVVHADLKARPKLPQLNKRSPKPLQLHGNLQFKDVCYAYPKANAKSLKDISLNFKVGSTTGIVGGTGAGKTTLVDILLGLLRPTRGDVIVDGKPITDATLGAWQQNLGYVPQDIFLIDASIRENIALGIPPDEIDDAQVVKCAQLAQVHEFVTSELNLQYNTTVGERGVRLSGGQRQRIGIARALYRDPEVLIFDEATSALDNLTEREVMKAVDKLSNKKTIIMIAHRLSTVKACDNIVVLEKGKIVGQGNYQELKEENYHFQLISEEPEVGKPGSAPEQ